MNLAIRRVGIIGFGEVGSILGADLVARGCNVRAYDVLCESPGERSGVRLTASHAEAMQDAELIISAVTASATRPVAEKSAATIAAGQFYLDVNSAAPATKIACAQLLDARGGRYVEAAVMTSVPPYRIKVPMLLGGAHAEALSPALAQLEFDVTPIAQELGIASAIKLCRSVIIKGLEALVIESFTAARAYKVEQFVLASLKETFPQIDWEKQGDYFFSRVIQHGKRRAEEMQASAEMISSLGIEGTMAAASSTRQSYVAQRRAGATFSDPLELKPWRARADELLALPKCPSP